MDSSLFGAQNVHGYFAGLHKQIEADIERLSPAEVAAADVDALATQLAERYKVTCPVLRDSDVSLDPPPFSPGQDSLQVSVYVPYTGDMAMFNCHGTNYPIITAPIEVRPNSLVVRVRVERRDIQALPNTVQRLIGQINSGLDDINRQLNVFNPDLKNQAAHMIRARQAAYASHNSFLSGLGQTGFEIRRRDDGREALIVPIKPRVINVPPLQKAGQPQKEPELSLADYDAILDVIQAMAKVYERSPSVFRTMDEEHLRTILLVGLNGIFKGDATGETFNGEGKNDILIRVNDNNIFIAECLFWDGEAKFKKKITEQLLRYATWRDSKLAAIVFNRKQNFTAVVDKMRAVTAQFDHRVAEMCYSAPHSCRHRFQRADDPQRQFILTCMAFEVPA